MIIRDVSYLEEGSVTITDLAGWAFLVDINNLSRLSKGHSYERFGGPAKHSRMTLSVPYAAHWYVVIYADGSHPEVSVYPLAQAA